MMHMTICLNQDMLGLLCLVHFAVTLLPWVSRQAGKRHPYDQTLLQIGLCFVAFRGTTRSITMEMIFCHLSNENDVVLMH